MCKSTLTLSIFSLLILGFFSKVLLWSLVFYLETPLFFSKGHHLFLQEKDFSFLYYPYFFWNMNVIVLIYFFKYTIKPKGLEIECPPMKSGGS